MYRVLLVEDEEPVLDSYEFMLKSTDDFVCAGKARSGYEAIKLIYELSPDLVFIDINIPGPDGIAVIAEVHDKFPATDFIISTAYERFDLARKAMPLGVFAYLVKPVTKKTFFETLNLFREHCGARLRNAAFLSGLAGTDQDYAGHAGVTGVTGGEEPLPPAVLQVLRRLIREPLGEEEWKTCSAMLHLPSEMGLVCILESGDPDYSPGLAAPNTVTTGNLAAPDTAAGKAVAEKLSRRYFCLHDAAWPRDIFVVSGNVNRAAFEKQVAGILEELSPAACCFGIGGVYRGTELWRSREEAEGELRRKRKGTDALLRYRISLARLRQKAGIAPPEEVKKLFALLRGEVFSACDFIQGKAKMLPVFMFLIDDCSGFFRGEAEEWPFPDVADEIMKPATATEWEAWADDIFDQILRRITLRRSRTFPLPLIRAVEYIHGHYAEGLQLSSVAEAARVSSTYLSRLFTEHLKTNFIDYLTSFRMEKAEKLLRESRLNIKEISRMTGYQDPNYFSRLFRRLSGHSPHEIRNALSRSGTEK